MRSLSPRLAVLAAGALGCLLALAAAPALHAQAPRRLYGVIDADYLGFDIAFSVELGGRHAVAFYDWGRQLDEIEGMAFDGEGELYLFSESGVVMKADARNPARALAPAGQGEYEVSSASWRRSDGMIELYDAKGAQFVTYDPQRDRFVSGSERRLTPRGRELSGLARTSTGLYAVTLAGEGAGLFVCANDHCTRTCPAITLPAEVQSLDTWAGSSLVTAWTSISETLQLVLHVETIDPVRCVRASIVTVELDRARLRPFLKRGIDLDGLLREARRRGTSAEIEAIAVH